MPIRVEDVTTPSGLHYLRFDVEGRVELEDANQLERWGAPGRSHHRGYVLSRIAKGTAYSPDARKAFSAQSHFWTAVAIVVGSPWSGRPST